MVKQDSGHTIRHRPETQMKREEILRVAALMFGEKGTGNTTLHDIAEKVGMTHAGVLHYFGSKRGLLLEVLKYRDQADVSNLQGHHMPGGLDTFRHLVKTAYTNAHRPGIVQTYLILSSESVTEGNPGRSYFVERYHSLRAELSQALMDIVSGRGGSIDDATKRKIADASACVLAAMDGLQLQWLLDPREVDLGPATAFIVKAAVSAVVDEDVIL